MAVPWQRVTLQLKTFLEFHVVKKSFHLPSNYYEIAVAVVT